MDEEFLQWLMKNASTSAWEEEEEDDDGDESRSIHTGRISMRDSSRLGYELPEEDPAARKKIAAYLRDLEVEPPSVLFRRLEELGYKGQEEARRAACLMAYRHIRRLRRIYIDKVPREKVGPKSNILFMGPTGSGKTFLVELLFGKLVRIPSVVVDVTAFSETGYVGMDTNNIITRLYHAADRDPDLTKIGIICLDEFDKLASGQNNAVFAGAGTTKDVTGLGVQRELLKMLEGSVVHTPVEMTHASYVETLDIYTGDIGFVAVGAFSGFAKVLGRMLYGTVAGFGRKTQSTRIDENAIAHTFTEEEVAKISYFQSYGFLPELVARFTRIVPLRALDSQTLKTILQEQVIDRAQEEFASEGLTLEVTDGVMDRVIEEALRRETGARGLTSLLSRYIEEVAFEYFGTGEQGITVRLVLKDGRIVPEKS